MVTKNENEKFLKQLKSSFAEFEEKEKINLKSVVTTLSKDKNVSKPLLYIFNTILNSIDAKEKYMITFDDFVKQFQHQTSDDEFESYLEDYFNENCTTKKVK
jgi:hypothetical protein